MIIRFDAAQLNGDLENFPVYVELTGSEIPGNFSSTVNGAGNDIRVTNSSGAQLPYELVDFSDAKDDRLPK